MRVELLSLLGQGAQCRKNALAMFRRLKLLGIETPGKDTGQGLKEGVHGRCDTAPCGTVLGHSSPLEEAKQRNQKPDQSR